MSPFNFICDADSVDIHRRTGNYFTTQRHQDADALYAFKSRGFGGEVGLDASETVDYNMPVAVVRENTQLCTYFFNLFTPTY